MTEIFSHHVMNQYWKARLPPPSPNVIHLSCHTWSAILGLANSLWPKPPIYIRPVSQLC
jgi:hypothetical protein